ncbi:MULTISPECIES: lysoplasmalogenase [unclassified Virgibacillus]|uniref:lysoplasmalogenase n=1 Tax=unclassified Virgibacillus TaxID=2620237 RepID=UPI0024DE79A0|nr:lysoplasmalogenase [Virgibacillus sp. LDC-1]
MILYRLPILIAVMGLVYIYIVPAEPFAIKLIFKIVPMLMIIYYAATKMDENKKPVHRLLLIGLFICMIGDATIHWFIIGLAAFLIGHLFYIAGFITQWKFSIGRFLAIVPIGIYGFLVGREIIEAVQDKGQQSLILPIIFYMLTISVMAWTAIMTRNKWATIGSLLFVISDSILAWNKFVVPLQYADSLIMLTYYAAQFFIAHSLWTISGKRKQIIW